MEAVEAAIEPGDAGQRAVHAGDRWLADCTLSGFASKVRDGIEAWRDARVRTPIVTGLVGPRRTVAIPARFVRKR